MIGEAGLRPPGVTVGALAKIVESSINHGIFRIEKRLGDWTQEQIDAGEAPEPFEALEFENAYTNAGGAALLDLLIGAGGTAFNNANAYLGVGDSNTANNVAQTDLQAASNKLRKAMDSTYPSRSGQVVTWRSTFASADANFTWAECALFNAAAAGTMLCRIVQTMGTKSAGTTWTLTYTITVP